MKVLLRHGIASAIFVTMLSVTASAANPGGVGLNYRTAGEGPTIIFVHGWTCDISVWADQLSEFDDDYRVVALDLPGHGQSPPPADGIYTMGRFAEAIESVRADTGADQIVLVGHSMGVMVIRQYALLYPDRVAGLLAVDGFVPPPPDDEADGVPQQAPPREEGWRDQFIESMFVARTSPELRQQIRRMMLRAPDSQALAIAASMRDPAAQTARVMDAPMLAVMSDRRPPPDITVFRQILPNLEIRQVPQTGHFLMMEVPGEFNAQMRGFLQEIGY